MVSNQVEYLSRVQEITHVNGASADNGVMVTAPETQPEPSSEHSELHGWTDNSYCIYNFLF